MRRLAGDGAHPRLIKIGKEMPSEFSLVVLASFVGVIELFLIASPAWMAMAVMMDTPLALVALCESVALILLGVQIGLIRFGAEDAPPLSNWPLPLEDRPALLLVATYNASFIAGIGAGLLFYSISPILVVTSFLATKTVFFGAIYLYDRRSSGNGPSSSGARIP